MNIGRACGIFMNIDSENFTEDEKLVAIRDVLKEMVTYNGITKDNILKAFRWFFDWAVEEASADSGEWIQCSERLPEDESIMYWTTHEDGSLVMHGYTKKNGFIYNWEVDDLEKRKRQGDVIAWKPISLPEPYKEDKE